MPSTYSFEPAGERQRRCLSLSTGCPIHGAVRQHRDRRALRGVAGGAELRRADDRVGGFGVDERVVEEAERELLAQQAPRRGVETLLGDLAVGDELEQQLGARLAAELVGSGIQDLLHALARRQVLDAPRAGRERLAEDRRRR